MQTLNSKDVRYQCCNCSENAFHFKLEEKKSVDFAWAGLSYPGFTDHLLFLRLVFAAPRGGLKKQFLLYTGVVYTHVLYMQYTCTCRKLKVFGWKRGRYSILVGCGFEVITLQCHVENICDRLYITDYSLQNIKAQFSTSSSYWTFADKDDAFLFSIRLIVLKVYNGKCGKVENAHFEKCPFPIPYSYSVY